MKLQLNHIAPYLPYGLKMKNPNTNRIIDLRGITVGVDTYTIHANVKIGVTFTDVDYQANLWPLKPLLLPLSSLNSEQLKEIVKNLFKDSQMIRPCYTDLHPIKYQQGFITFYDDNTMQSYTAVKPSAGTGLPVLNMSNHYSDYEVFFKMNIDMFGLIDAGLALNKNDYIK